MPVPTIRVAPRFLDAVERAGPGLTAGYYREIQDFRRRYESSRATVARPYDRAEQLKPHVVLEFKVGSGARMLGHWEPPVLTMLDAGNHEIVPTYETGWLPDALMNAVDLPEAHPVHGGLFGNAPEMRSQVYGAELDPNWIYFLADQQASAASKIRKAYKRANVNDPDLFVLVGGPGTGKTSILLKLLLDFKIDGIRPGIVMSDAVAAYASGGLGMSLAPFLVHVGADEHDALDRFDVLLFDDPGSLAEVDAALDAGIGEVRLVVVGFDPCQLDEDLWDEDFQAVLAKYSARHYELRTCYRQKENVGRATKRVMDRVAESTPFLDRTKIAGFKGGHELVYRIANNLRFVNRYGYERTYPNATEKDVQTEAKRIRKAPLWTHSVPLLVVVDRSCESGWQWTALLRDIPHQRVEFDPASRWSSLREIKGLEYQHVMLVINRVLFEELESGFEGSGQNVYHARRMLRIPFSRAKDSLITFVAESPSDRAETVDERRYREALTLLRNAARSEIH